MKKYPLKIVYTFALTNSVGIADPRNSVSSVVLVIEDISLDKVKECINLIENTTYENGNNKMLVLDLVRNNKYYRVAVSGLTLARFLGLTTIDHFVIEPDEYDYPDEHIKNYQVFEMEVLPESECLVLQKSTLEWFKETYEDIPSHLRDAANVVSEMYLTTTYNGRTVILLSAVDKYGKGIEHHMHYLDSINSDQDGLNTRSNSDEIDMSKVVDEVKAGNLQFAMNDIDALAELANYSSRDELIGALVDKGYSPSNLYEITAKAQR